MLGFFQTVAASALGFVAAKFATAWFDARIGHAGYLERERNDDVATLSRLSTRVAELGAAYWLRDRSDGDDADTAMLTANIGRMTRLLPELFDDKALGERQACTLELDRLDDAVTSGDFGGKNRKAEPARVVRILKAAADFETKVKSCRRKLRPKWWS